MLEAMAIYFEFYMAILIITGLSYGICNLIQIIIEGVN